MRGYGTYNQPPGSWSDDSSLSFCLCESLSNGYNLNDLGKRFVDWYCKGYWSAHGKVFDIGATTMKAINNIKSGVNPIEAGMDDECSNGNGSLMRILPLAFYLEDKEIDTQFKCSHEVSCLTYGHLRSQMACGIYIQIAVNLIKEMDPQKAYEKMKDVVLMKYGELPYIDELKHFNRIIKNDISNIPIEYIKSSGYVIDSLEAGLWCLLNNNTYKKTVLSAVNLGEDTDTISAIAGGLAGIYYQYHGIPRSWIDALARKEDILELGNKYYQSLLYSTL